MPSLVRTLLPADPAAVGVKDDRCLVGRDADLHELRREFGLARDAVVLDARLVKELAIGIFPANEAVTGDRRHSGDIGHKAAILDLFDRGVSCAALGGIDVEGDRELLLRIRVPPRFVDGYRAGRANTVFSSMG